MSYFVTFRRGWPGNYQFSPRSVFASLEDAHASAERAFASEQVEYLIEDERGPVTYRLATSN
jgi:hypothetical protein